MNLGKNTALIVLNFPEGIAVSDEIKSNIKKVSEFFISNNLPVIKVNDASRKNELIDNQTFELQKRKISAFIGTDLELILSENEITTVFVVGGLADVDTRFTCLDAHQSDYTFFVATDTIVGSDDEAYKYALLNMTYLQRVSNTTTENILKGEF